MKMKTLILLSFLISIIMGIIVNAAEIPFYTHETILSEQAYTGSLSDFNIIISQENINKSNFKNNLSTTITSSNTSLGINYKISFSDKIDNQNLIMQFTKNSNDIIQIENDNSLVLLNSRKDMIGAVSNLQLKDANGNLIETTVNQTNNKVYYSLEDEYATYPISGDITLYGVNDFSQWFTSGSWITRDGKLSLSLNHTGWAYAGISTGPISWSWSTVVNKFSSSSNWSNAQGLLEQYQCHVNFAANKNPWNLEPWRPSVGYTATIAAACNP